MAAKVKSVEWFARAATRHCAGYVARIDRPAKFGDVWGLWGFSDENARNKAAVFSSEADAERAAGECVGPCMDLAGAGAVVMSPVRTDFVRGGAKGTRWRWTRRGWRREGAAG